VALTVSAGGASVAGACDTPHATHGGGDCAYDAAGMLPMFSSLRNVTCAPH
jgi:hypothetical protein